MLLESIATKKWITGNEHDGKRVPLLEVSNVTLGTEVIVIAWCSVNHTVNVQRISIFWKFSLLLKITMYKLTKYTHGSDCAVIFF